MKITKDHKMLMEDMGVECNHFKKICDAIRIGLEFTPLYEREKNIVLGVLSGGKTLKEVGAEYDITQERTRQIYEKALRRLKYAIHLYVTEQDELHKEVARLREENSFLKLKNEELGQIIRESKIESSSFLEDFAPEHIKALALRIEDLDISVRAKNCCKCAGLETLGDVFLVGKKGLLRYRNFGRRSLSELCELLSVYGLELKD